MTSINLDGLSKDTLVAIIRDQELNAAEARYDRKNIEEYHGHTLDELGASIATAEEWEAKYHDSEARLQSELERSSKSTTVYNRSAAQGRKDICAELCAKVADDFSTHQAHTVLGLVGELGYRIMAIKAYRDRSGRSLKESREAIDEFRDRLTSKW